MSSESGKSDKKSPFPESPGGPSVGGDDPMASSLNMSASSTTIAAALSSSANMGGKAVTISLPTQTPLKSAASTPGHAPLSQTTPMTEGASAKEREAAIDDAMAVLDSATAKSVTINEKQNMEQSPSSSAYVDTAGVPVLKDAGAERHRLDSRASPSPAKATLSPSPVRPKKVASHSPLKASPSPAKQQQPVKKEITDQERAKAKYLLNRAYRSEEQNAARESNDRDRRDNDRYSSYSGSSGSSYSSRRSVKTVESDIAKRLRTSQQRLRESQGRGSRSGDGVRRSSEAALDAVFSSLSEQQQALFLSMKDTKTRGRSRMYQSSEKGRARSGSPDAKSVSSYNDTRSSRSGGTSRTQDSRGRPSSASVSSKASSKKNTLRLSTADIHKINDRLSQPVHIEPSAEAKKADPTLRYLLIDEAKNCGRKPFKAKKWAGSNRADDDPDAKSNFVERMATQEYHRIEDMQHKRAAADYDALLTRKQCPNCGLKQKYDEVKDKKNMCPNCDIEYRPKLTWGQVGKKFTTRTANNAKKSAQKQEELIKQIEDSRLPVKEQFDPKTGKVVTIAAPKNPKRWTDNTKEQFFERMSEHEEKARTNLQKIEDESFGVQCTFMPKTGSKRNEEDEEDKGMVAFLRRLDEEGEERKERNPHLFSEKYQPDPLLANKPKWVPT